MTHKHQEGNTQQILERFTKEHNVLVYSPAEGIILKDINGNIKVSCDENGKITGANPLQIILDFLLSETQTAYNQGRAETLEEVLDEGTQVWIYNEWYVPVEYIQNLLKEKEV